MKKFRTFIIAVAAFFIFIAVTGFLIAPALIRPVLTKKITEALHREVRIEKLRINPFAVSATVSGFSVADTDRTTPFVAFEKLHVNVDAFFSIWRRAVILKELRLENPYVGLTRNPDGTYNFSDLIPADKDEKVESDPLRFSFNNIQITNGRIDFRDLPKSTHHTIRDVNVSVPFVSNIEYYLNHYVEPQFSAVVNDHSVIATGQTQPFLASRATRFDLDIQDIHLPHYLEYLPAGMNFKLISGRLDTKLRIQFIMHDNRPPELNLNGKSTLRDVVLDDMQGNALLRLKALHVDMANTNPFAENIQLANIALDTPLIAVRRDRQGRINWQNLIAEDNTSQAGRKPSPSPHDRKSERHLQIDNLTVDKGTVVFSDAVPAKTVGLSISPIALQAENLSTKKGDKANINLTLKINQTSDFSAKGQFGITPLMADLAVNLTSLRIRPFQPYFTETVNIDVTGGSVSTAGNLLLTINNNNEPAIQYAGNLYVNNLATTDRAQSLDFIKFKQLSFLTMSAGYNPLVIKVKEIALRDFFAKVVINPGGTTNLQDVFGTENPDEIVSEPPSHSQAASPTETDAAGQQRPDIQIGKVSFLGGTVDFADRNISPNYAATLLNLKGSVTGLSSQEITRAKVNLKGNLGYGSPIEVTGTINPLIKDLFADIRLSFKDIEMSTITPYTSRYLGYPVIKGKLRFDVSYLVDQRTLKAENKIFFDQLTFGDKVESPDAIAAPVTLAVSLLTDRQGQINLDVPVSGSLDDPEFRIWPIVWQILVNLITKAVTSPFSLLSSLTGGGEEMSFVEFDFGSTTPSQAEQDKITALSKALYDRPHLKLEIAAYVDETRDRDALKNAAFERLIKAQVQKESADKGRAAVPTQDVVIPQADYEKYLTMAYKAGKFSKPRNAIGILKALPAPEMEKHLRDAISITSDDLESLAAGRAQSVRKGLLQEGKIDAARIFLVKPKSLQPEKKEKIKDSRAEFKIK
ncbi:MAG: DUF748 domain-containing protein [Smithellaceae bacterium]